MGSYIDIPKQNKTNIHMIFDVKNWLWKSNFVTFPQLFLAFYQVSCKNQGFNLKCFFLSNSVVMERNLQLVK